MENNRDSKKLISIVSPTYNESDNVEELYTRVSTVMNDLNQYNFEYIIIDNASTDLTVLKLKEIAQRDKRIKLIINTRNFGHIRSPYWGIIQSSGDATVYLASDLQDPPELIVELIRLWEGGEQIVLATKPVSSTNPMFHLLRRSYYQILDAMSDVELVKDTTGFGIYDKSVIQKIREVADPYPYLRGLICELGYKIKTIDFNQPARLRGVSKNNFYTLYDIAWLGIVSHSLIPVRLAGMLGFCIGLGSIVAALGFIIVKFTNWEGIPVGIAPLTIGMFFMFGVVLLFLGIIGEYVGSILNYVQNRPVVVESERVNFE